MRVCVVYASKYEATAGIARVIGEVLEQRGCSVQVAEAAQAPAAEPFDAVIVGSAVYVGQWRREAVAYLRTHAEVLRQRPVWLFSSGPIGRDDPQPRDPSPQAGELLQLVGAREHRVFTGALDRSKLGWVDRTIAGALKVPEGDFRDWDAVRDWAADVADALDDLASG